jgi:hypothetical protein
MTAGGVYARRALAQCYRARSTAFAMAVAMLWAQTPVLATAARCEKLRAEQTLADCLSAERGKALSPEGVKLAFDSAAAAPSIPAPDPAAAIEIPQAYTPPPAPPVEPAAQQPAELPTEELAPVNLPPVATLNEFLMNGDYTSLLGVRVREASAPLRNGGEVEGLAVEAVIPGSPAARAGIQPYRATTHYVIDGVFAAASFVFPPAMLLLVVADQSRVGTSFDLIIGVDGVRVTNILEFDDQVRNSKPGDIVYLNVVRKGKRVQIPVEMPRATIAASK